jgi:hypothetical protein
MRTASQETTQPCPQCGAEISADGRFIIWCATCDWNVEPASPKEERRRLERARRTLARRHGEKVLTEVKDGQILRARRDASSLG